MPEITSEAESLINHAALMSVTSGMAPQTAEECSAALMKIVPHVEHRAAYLASRTAINAAGMAAAIRMRGRPLSAQSRVIFTVMLSLLEKTTETIRAALAYEGEADDQNVKH